MSLRDDFAAYLARRADEPALKPETDHDRHERLAQSFADAIRPHLERLTPPAPEPSGVSADDLMAAIAADTAKENR